MNENWIKDYLKRYPCTVLKSGNVRTCPVRLSFPNLFEAKASTIGGVTGKPKFSTALLFPRGANLDVLVDYAVLAADKEWADKWRSKLPNGDRLGKGTMNIRFPFRDGEDMEHKGGFEAGAWWLNVSSDTMPGVCDSRAQQITNQRDIYPGIWALVTLRAYAYDADVNKGVSLGLQNVQKLADDTPLGSVRARAEDEFEPLEEEEAPPHQHNSARGNRHASLADL